MSEDNSFCFKQVVDLAKDIVIVTKAQPLSNSGPEIVYVNKAFEKLTGYSSEDAVGQTPRILQSENTDPKIKSTIRNALKAEQSVSVVVQNRSKKGKDYWLELNIFPLFNEFGAVTHYAAIERDCTHFKQTEKRLKALSLRDPLTKMYNRRAINEKLPDAFEDMKAGNLTFVIVTIDIDYFKSINDRFGHDTGDQVIVRISKLITETVGDSGWSARSGGEEFIVYFQGTDVNDIANIAEKIRHVIEQQVFDSDTNKAFTTTVSIGLAKSDPADEDEWQVMRRSDKALYDAKNAGRNRVCLR